MATSFKTAPSVHKSATQRPTRYLRAALSEAVGLSLEEIRELSSLGLFPAASCDAIWGPSWEKSEIDAWAIEWAQVVEALS